MRSTPTGYESEPAPASGVTAVVVTFNSAAVLPAFLDSLPAAFGSLTYEVVVADNDSRDATVHIVEEQAPHATVVQLGSNRGYSAGINAGLERRSLAGPVLVLNPDVRLAPDAVGVLLGALDEPGVGITVPRIVGPHGETELSLRRDPSVLRAWGEALLGGHRAGRLACLGEMVAEPSTYEQPGSVDWATGAVMLISLPCATAVGAWDERFFLYSEETDYAIRARAAGFELHYVPTACVVHLGGESNTAPALWSLLVENRIRLYRKYHGRGATTVFATGVVVNEGLRALAGQAVHRAAIRALAGVVLAGWRTRRLRLRGAGSEVDTQTSGSHGRW